jgi:hypothetical protein
MKSHSRTELVFPNKVGGRGGAAATTQSSRPVSGVWPRASGLLSPQARTIGSVI